MFRSVFKCRFDVCWPWHCKCLPRLYYAWLSARCVCMLYVFLSHSDVGRAMCFSSWVLRCKPDLGHLQFCF